jgi:hypothetical protein
MLVPVDQKYGRLKPKSPAAVAYEKNWWGASNPDLNAKCEEACGKLESRVPPLLRRLQRSWPLDYKDRGILAQFAALHVARTEGFADWFSEAREKSLAEYQAEFSSAKSYEKFREQMQSDAERAKKILKLNKMASLIGWMHWTLVIWDEPLLVTSDQPVAPVPILGEGETQEVSVVPRRGWSSLVEVRFPLSPNEALLGTWHPGNMEAKIARGTWETAVEFNAVTRAQARRYYHSPEQEPAMPPAILREPVLAFEPISPSLLPGYSAEVALNSERRQQATAEVNRLIEKGDDKTLSIAIAEERQTA